MRDVGVQGRLSVDVVVGEVVAVSLHGLCWGEGGEACLLIQGMRVSG